MPTTTLPATTIGDGGTGVTVALSVIALIVSIGSLVVSMINARHIRSQSQINKARRKDELKPDIEASYRIAIAGGGVVRFENRGPLGYYDRVVAVLLSPKEGPLAALVIDGTERMDADLGALRLGEPCDVVVRLNRKFGVPDRWVRRRKTRSYSDDTARFKISCHHAGEVWETIVSCAIPRRSGVVV